MLYLLRKNMKLRLVGCSPTLQTNNSSNWCPFSRVVRPVQLQSEGMLIFASRVLLRRDNAGVCSQIVSVLI